MSRKSERVITQLLEHAAFLALPIVKVTVKKRKVVEADAFEDRCKMKADALEQARRQLIGKGMRDVKGLKDGDDF